MKVIYNDIKIDIKTNILPNIRVGLGSSCMSEKAFLLGWLISNYDLKSTLDLGVYYGGSLFPQAYTHKKYTNGIVYAVDPYTKEDFTQYETFLPLDVLNNYIASTDFDEIYNSVISSINENNYENNIVFLRQRSDKAIDYFRANNISFNLMHIDGNHDRINANSDIELYLPLLQKNGFLILDDVIFPSLQDCYERLKKELCLCYKNDLFAIFQKSYEIDDDFKLILETLNTI